MKFLPKALLFAFLIGGSSTFTLHSVSGQTSYQTLPNPFEKAERQHSLVFQKNPSDKLDKENPHSRKKNKPSKHKNQHKNQQAAQAAIQNQEVSFAQNNKPFVVEDFWLMPTPDTTLLQNHSYQNFQPTLDFRASSEPQLQMEWLALGDEPTPADMERLLRQKIAGMQIFAEFVSFVSLSKVEYKQKLEEVLAEEALAVDEALFFNPDDPNICLIEDIEVDYSLLPALSDAEMQARLKALEKEMPLNYTPEVRKFIDKYGVHYRHYTAELIKRSNRYFPLFEQILKEEGVPEELKYLVVVESAFQPKAISRAGAGGLWQFMPKTGKIFDLTQNHYIDERFEPIASTRAAARLLKYLYEMFGDWELALASYNCGPGNVKKAMQRSGKKTFWEIYDYLPRETRNYVPLYTSYVYLFNHQEEHSIFASELHPSLDITQIEVYEAIKLSKLAEQLNVCVEDLEAINPHLKKGFIPAYRTACKVNIPTKRKTFFEENEAAIILACKGGTAPIKTNTTQTSTKQQTLVAQNQQVSQKTSIKTSTTAKANQDFHTVSKGETLSQIALRYKVSAEDIKKWNGMKSAAIYTGQKIKVAGAKTEEASTVTASTAKKTYTSKTTTARYHTVRAGDSLWKISQQYTGLTVEKLKKLNGLKSDKLNIGQKLRVL
ncbi:lytic transglycosylase domain-containing protein [Hugenholtzia roseola]|uniref:lytic transglycosylase domain-containing protein n=1 Tax=Hugenholtzia roseola TaxID=1002 RepID=UPI0003FC8209|nr:lytic transglycosylase domain-containing protein [Hugenholtzia roseola]